MADEDLKNNIKTSFSKVKEHILALEIELLDLKNIIFKQNTILKELSEHFINHLNQCENLKKSQNQPISTGSKGVNQSINHLINQSLNNQSLNHSNLSTNSLEIPLDSSFSEEPKISNEEPKKPEITIGDIPPAEKTNQSINQKNQEKHEQNHNFRIDLGTITQKKQTFFLNQEISSFKININKIFSLLSKQELRVFLTLYQLDDDLNGVSYIELSSKLELTEPCIRGYISTLMKKGIPITRTKLNNKRTILTINKDFKSLGLKQKLVSLYYEADPHQTTLFDIHP